MRKYILYAEDDYDDCIFLKKALEEISSDIELVNVPTGYDLIKFLQDKDQTSYPSIILMDMKMPMLDGKETLDLLKLDDKLKDIPVMILSGSNFGYDLNQIALEGGSKFKKKPSRYDEWLAIAKELAKYCTAVFLAMVIK